MKENKTSVFVKYGYVHTLYVPAKIAEELKLRHKDRVRWVVNEDGSATIKRVEEI